MGIEAIANVIPILAAAAEEPAVQDNFIMAVRIVVAGATIAIGSIGPAFAEGGALRAALESIARQPDASGVISRTLFVGLAMVESTAIYCLVMAFIILFVK